MLEKPPKHYALPEFLAWKSPRAHTQQYNNGQFVDYIVRSQWFAYRQACVGRVKMPEQPSEAVLDAIINAGVRSQWAAEVYEKLRKALLADEARGATK